MQTTRKQFGQGMTEYIIIVALIAIAAIAAYSFFGDTLRSQVGGMATELSGQDGGASVTSAATAAGDAVDQSAHANLSTYTDKQTQ
ncbi:MAG: pilus assembly protein [Gammaproteobacteria bacterium]|nr:pilus assembly protein [Gammaproteobacteria bacterium]